MGHNCTTKNYPVGMLRMLRLRNFNLLKECYSWTFFQGFFENSFCPISVRNSCISAEQWFWLNLQHKYKYNTKLNQSSTFPFFNVYWKAQRGVWVA